MNGDDHHIKHARMLLGQGRHDLARGPLREALGQDPDDAEATRAAGLVPPAGRRVRPGDRAGPAGHRAGPRRAVLPFRPGQCLPRPRHAQGRDAPRRGGTPPRPRRRRPLAPALERPREHQLLRESLDAAERGLSLDAEHAGCSHMRVIALRGLGRGAEAADANRGLLGREPDSAAHANAGWTSWHRSQIRQAKTHFREALAWTRRWTGPSRASSRRSRPPTRSTASTCTPHALDGHQALPCSGRSSSACGSASGSSAPPWPTTRRSSPCSCRSWSPTSRSCCSPGCASSSTSCCWSTRSGATPWTATTGTPPWASARCLPSRGLGPLLDHRQPAGVHRRAAGLVLRGAGRGRRARQALDASPHHGPRRGRAAGARPAGGLRLRRPRVLCDGLCLDAGVELRQLHARGAQALAPQLGAILASIAFRVRSSSSPPSGTPPAPAR